MLRCRSGKIGEVDEDRQHDDRPAVVAEVAVDPLQRLQQRHDEPREHAEVDRANKLRQGKGLRELQDECRATRTNADPDPEATRARIHAKRSYRTWTDPDGTGHLHLTGPSDVIARVDNAVRHRCDRIFRDARNEGRREPTDAYAFDAAAELLTSGGDGTPVPAGADAKIIVRVDLPALLRGRAGRRRDLRDRRARPDPGVGRAGVDGRRVPRRRGHQGHRDHQGRAPRAAVHQRAAHRAAVAGPDLRPQGLRQPARPRVRPLRGLGRHPHHPRRGRPSGSAPPATASRPPAGHVSDPDADGQCTFTPPAAGPVEDCGDPTLVHELAEATQAALRSRRGALART